MAQERALTSNTGGGGAGRSTTSMATPGSYLPGGVNTNNPGSRVNQAVASLSRPQGKPTQANKPVARDVATTNPSKATKESMAKAAAANAGKTSAAPGKTSTPNAGGKGKEADANRADASKGKYGK
jgi:hypothetical protein